MGAFGAANYVMHHPFAFKTLGIIIGVLDFTRQAVRGADAFLHTHLKLPNHDTHHSTP
jgi:hypothetical protein